MQARRYSNRKGNIPKLQFTGMGTVSPDQEKSTLAVNADHVEIRVRMVMEGVLHEAHYLRQKCAAGWT